MSFHESNDSYYVQIQRVDSFANIHKVTHIRMYMYIHINIPSVRFGHQCPFTLFFFFPEALRTICCQSWKRDQQTMGLGPNPTLFSNYLQANDIYSLNHWKQIRRRIILADTWKLCEIPIAVSINKVFWILATFTGIYVVSGCFLHYNGKAE